MNRIKSNQNTECIVDVFATVVVVVVHIFKSIYIMSLFLFSFPFHHSSSPLFVMTCHATVDLLDKFR